MGVRILQGQQASPAFGQVWHEAREKALNSGMFSIRRPSPRTFFAVSGVFILLILFIFIGGSLTLYAWRASALKQGGLFAPISRKTAIPNIGCVRCGRATRSQ
jgi:hypothetical protein